MVPWAIQGAHWDAGPMAEPDRVAVGQLACSHCGRELHEVHVLVVRHRGPNRVPDHFCSVDHLLEWAKAGGRWQ